MSEPSPGAPSFDRAVSQTRDILEGLEEGRIRATELPQLLEARAHLFPRPDDPADITEADRKLVVELQDLDRRLLKWCQRALGETREHLSRARRTARASNPPRARLVSESA